MAPPNKRPHFSTAFQKTEPAAEVAAKQQAPKEETEPKQRKRVAKPQTKQQRSRVGKVQLPLWVSPEARKQLKMLAVESERPQEGLLQEALNDLFKKYGKPRIAN